MNEKQNTPELSGILIIDKPTGITSHDVVWKVRKLFGTKKVGHTGTLDPLASGVLVVLIGRAAKAAEYLVCDDKKYSATLRLGLTTDTEDITGEVLTTHVGDLPKQNAVIDACSKFVGNIKQIPPMYSALKVDGKKLYELAREGKTVEREARDITVFSLEATPADALSDYTLDVHCSSGTYIRTLCADIGASLGCGGVMASLRRTSAGGFDIDDATTLDALEQMTMIEREALLLPVDSLFSTLEAVKLPAFYEKLCRNGCEIYQKKIKTVFATGTRVRLCTADGRFFALGEVRDFDDGSAIKAIKFFEI